MKLTGYESIIGDTKPSLVDTSNPTLIYEAYKSGHEYLVCRIDLSTSVISRSWATGAWEDRATLSYN